MKTKFFPVLLIAAGLLALGARAQSTDTTAQAAAPQPAQVVYSPRLPSAAELTNAAAAQGLTVDKIVQSASQMTLVYHTANGQTHTVAYQLLPTPGPVDHTAPETHAALESTAAAPSAQTPQVVYAPSTAAPQVVYAAPASQTVVYSAPAPAYYSPYYSPYYYPGYYSPWYAPVALSVGFGFGYYGGYYGGYHGGHYHGGGGYHGGHGGGHH